MQFAWNRTWARSLMLGLGFLLIALLVWVSYRGFTVPPASEKRPEAEQAQPHAKPAEPAGPPPKPAAPPENKGVQLNRELEQVIAGLRDANQKKDLPQLLSHYSSNFPQLPQRAQTISKAWKIYDYPKMDYEIHEVRSLSDNKAVARVTWQVEAQEINTSKRKSVSRTYLITFVKESGQWRIVSVAPAK